MLKPYNVQSFENGLIFVTDFDVEYRIVFEKHSSFDEIGYQSFEFSFYPVGKKHAFFDARIKSTIFDILQNFLSQRPDAILIYICDSADNLARVRNILFNRWFKEIAITSFVKLNRQIIDTDLDIIYYMACVFNEEFVAGHIIEPYLNLEVQNLSK